MQKLALSIKSFDIFFIKKSVIKIFQIASFFPNIRIKRVSLPAKKKVYTVLRSPHIDKKSREQFEIRRYKVQLILTFQKTSSTTLFLYILKNSLFPGVEIQILYKNTTFFELKG